VNVNTVPTTFSVEPFEGAPQSDLDPERDVYVRSKGVPAGSALREYLKLVKEYSDGTVTGTYSDGTPPGEAYEDPVSIIRQSFRFLERVEDSSPTAFRVLAEKQTRQKIQDALGKHWRTKVRPGRDLGFTDKDVISDLKGTSQTSGTRDYLRLLESYAEEGLTGADAVKRVIEQVDTWGGRFFAKKSTARYCVIPPEEAKEKVCRAWKRAKHKVKHKVARKREREGERERER
jgi:hypothetical protein